MRKKAIIDSGPFIGLFDKDDKFHKRSIEFIKNYKGVLHTTLPVITEVTHILDFSVSAQVDFLSWLAQGAVKIVEIKKEDIHRIIELTKKYSDVPMDFADASLVVVAERESIKDIVSIDKDFYIYRSKKKSPFNNIFLS